MENNYLVAKPESEICGATVYGEEPVVGGVKIPVTACFVCYRKKGHTGRCLPVIENYAVYSVG